MRRNPRRAYDKEGRMFQPATIGSIRRDFECETIQADCDACQHSAMVSIEGLPDPLPVPDVALRLRCTACGSKRVSSRLNMVEVHEALTRATGWRSR